MPMYPSITIVFTPITVCIILLIIIHLMAYRIYELSNKNKTNVPDEPKPKDTQRIKKPSNERIIDGTYIDVIELFDYLTDREN